MVTCSYCQKARVVIVKLLAFSVMLFRFSVFFAVSGAEMEVERSFGYPDNEYYVTKLKDNMAAGNYSFTLKFRSNVSSTLTGFYKSKYKHDGVER